MWRLKRKGQNGSFRAAAPLHSFSSSPSAAMGTVETQRLYLRTRKNSARIPPSAECMVFTSARPLMTLLSPSSDDSRKITSRYLATKTTRVGQSSSSTSFLATESSSTASDTTSKNEQREIYLRLASFAEPEYKLIGASAATLGITSSVTLLLPYMSGQVIDMALAASNGSGGDEVFHPTTVALGLFGLTALAGAGVYARSLMLAKAGNRIVARMRRQLFASTLEQDASYFDMNSHGDLLSRLTSDTILVQSAVTDDAVSALRATVMSTGSIALLFYSSPSLALVSLSTLPPVFLAARRFGRKLKTRQEEVQELQSVATTLSEQALSGIKTVRQFAAEQHEFERYDRAITKAHDAAVNVGATQALFDGCIHVAANGAVLCVMGYGGTLVLSGEMSPGDLAGFLMYSLLFAGNIGSLSETYAEVTKAVAAAGRVFEVMDHKPSIPASIHTDREKDSTKGGHKNSIGDLIPTDTPLSVEFRNVSFVYPSRPDAPVLGPGFSLSVQPGEVLALVGGSGSGKSTVSALLTRLYDVSSPEGVGGVYVDGRDVRTLDASSLRRGVGVVAQEPLLFSGTIADNIRYGRLDATDEEVREAARVAHVLEFANRLPDGLDTDVGQRGSGLSGGQKQRVAIARTILKDPPIIVFDEATSALDSESEFHLKHAIETVMKGRTVISIAHRLSTIRGADKIAVLKGGTIVEVGPFDDLVKNKNGAFNELMGRQLVVDDYDDDVSR